MNQWHWKPMKISVLLSRLTRWLRQQEIVISEQSEQKASILSLLLKKVILCVIRLCFLKSSEIHLEDAGLGNLEATFGAHSSSLFPPSVRARLILCLCTNFFPPCTHRAQVNCQGEKSHCIPWERYRKESESAPLVDFHLIPECSPQCDS